MHALVAGLDLGSTSLKLLVTDDAGTTVALRSHPTPWQEHPDGTTTVSVEGLCSAVGSLLQAVAAELTAQSPAARVQALAVTGMGESGFLLDRSGQAVAPAFAWFDRSGAAAVEALPASLRDQFSGRTGLPWGVQVSAAKIAHLRDHGVEVGGTTWFSLPEFVVQALGGHAAGEWSLASRTGLLDQDTGRPWPALLAHLGLDDDCLPPLVAAGASWGQADSARVPAVFAEAQLTVAGHDHLVSAQSAGAVASGGYHVSMGTAEVLLRIVDEPLSFEARNRLGKHLINCVRHVVPGQYAVVAGVKTGLLLRRALAMVGAGDAASWHRIDDEVTRRMATVDPLESLTVSGARNDDGVLKVQVATDEVSPAALVHAILEHSNHEIARLIEAMDAELPPATTALLSGGWTSWACVRQARSRILPGLQVSTRPQDTAYGAVLCAQALVRRGLTAAHNTSQGATPR